MPLASLFRTPDDERRNEQRAMIDALPLPAWTASVAGVREYFNAEWRRVSGQAEPGDRTWTASVHDDDLDVATGPLDAIEGFREYRLKDAASGAFRTMRERVAAFRDEDGAVVGYFGVLVDCQDEHDAIARADSGSLAEQEATARLAAIVRSSRDAVIGMDLDGVINTWNGGAEALYGWTAEEAVGRDIRFIMPPDRAVDPRDVVARVKSGEAVGTFRTKRLRKDGTLIDVSLSIAPVLDADGAVAGAASIAHDVTERSRVEGELAASEARYRELANAVPAIVFTSDPAANLGYVNDYGLAYTGATEAEARDRGWLAYVHPDDAQPFLETARAAAPLGEPFETERRLRRADGEFRWHLLRQVPARNAAGEITGWVGTATDIHDRIVGAQQLEEYRAKVEAALAAQAETSALLETLFRNAPLGFAFLDPDLRFLRVNDELARVNGLAAADHIGLAFDKVVRSAPAHMLAEMRSAIATGKPVINVRSQTGSAGVGREVRHWLNSYYPVKRGSVTVGLGVLVRDVTSEVRVEQAITAENTLRRVISENATNAVFLVDDRGICTFVNPAAETMFGRKPTAIEGKSLHGMIHGRYADGRDHPEAKCPIQIAVKSGASLRGHEDSFVRADGSFFPAICAVSPVLDAGRPVGGVIEVRDVSGERLATERLSAAYARAQLLADAGAALADSGQDETLLERVARVSVPAFGDLCLVDVVSGDSIERTVITGDADAPKGVAAALRAITPSLRNRKDPIVQVIARGEPLMVSRYSETVLHESTRPPGWPAWLKRMGFSSGLIVPLAARGRIFGAVSLGARAGRAPYTRADLDTMVELGRRMGGWVDSAQLIRALQTSNESLNYAHGRLQLLADSGQRLGRSEDQQVTLEAMAAIAVPRFADVCVIDLVHGSRFERAAVAGAPYMTASLLAGVRAAVPELASEDDIVGRVATTAESAYIPDYDSKKQGQSRKRSAAAFDLIEATSLIAIPLASAVATYGVVTFALTRGQRRFSQADFEVATELGLRMGSWLEKAELIDDLRKANEAKDEFMGMISHEMRTPMTVINGGARVLSRRGFSITEEERTLLMGDMERESDRLLGMVDNLLTLARVELAEEPENEPVILERVVRRVVDSMVERGSPREFAVQIAPGLPLVAAHTGNLEQVLRNLLVNAEKYSVADEPIEIRCEPSDDHMVHVRVLDRGSGVASEELELIFQRFYRSDRTAKTTAGSGLGLALCKRLVESMDGRIWAKARKGGGLEVAFSVPVFDIDFEE